MNRRVHRASQALGPFERCHSVGGEILVQPDVVRIGAIQTVEIDVHKRKASTAVLVDKRESRTRDVVGGNAEPFGQAFDEGCLACTEIARKQDDRASGQLASELSCDGASFSFGT